MELKDMKLRVGPLYRLESEGEEMFAWVDHVTEDMVWFRERYPERGRICGFTVKALNRMEITEVIL